MVLFLSGLYHFCFWYLFNFYSLHLSNFCPSGLSQYFYPLHFCLLFWFPSHLYYLFNQPFSPLNLVFLLIYCYFYLWGWFLFQLTWHFSCHCLQVNFYYFSRLWHHSFDLFYRVPYLHLFYQLIYYLLNLCYLCYLCYLFYLQAFHFCRLHPYYSFLFLPA